MYFYKKPPHTGELPLIRFPLFFTNPETVVAAAKKKNIYLGRWYDQVIAPKELPLNKLHYIPGSCPIAESICKGIVNLPTTITEEEAEKILDIVAVEVN